MNHPENRRSARIPLCVPVSTSPDLPDCCSLNLSTSGIALAAALPHGTPPEAGAELSFALVLRQGAVQGRGRVEWVQRRAGSTGGRERIALGLSFLELPPASRAAVMHAMTEYRPRALIALASRDESALVRLALENEFALEEARTVEEATELLGAGSFSVVIAFGRTADAAAIASALGDEVERRGLHGPFEDPRPRIVFAAPAPPAELVDLYNRGVLFRYVPLLDAREIARVARIAAADFTAHSELLRLGLERERESQQKPRVGTSEVPDSGIVHQSEVMRATLELVRTAAQYHVAVLVSGETGTGKELIARSIHDLSPRAGAPFVAQDCGALTETLLESELFGHVRGAFTGAIANHPGLFAVAEGGTIFLDEIENMASAMQAKLLRVLETGEIRPVGGTVTKKVNVRVIAASNRDLWTEAQAGRFRADLYFRLNRFVIELPALRDRPGDLELLTDALLRRLCAELGREVPEVDARVKAALEGYSWPGNVRELRNVLERALLLTPAGRPIEPASLPRALGQARTRPRARLADRLAEHEAVLLREALARHGGVIRRAAAELGMNPVTFARRARRLGVLTEASADPTASRGSAPR